jgi:ergothioneine biosynthesis protein EgtB
MLASAPDPDSVRATAVAAYERVRAATDATCAPLEVEDYVVQSMPDASPAKWHLAHTTWFFETFLLERFAHGYRPFHARYAFLFNSYYQTVGTMHARTERGSLSRPTVAEVRRYRAAIDEQMRALLRTAAAGMLEEIVRRLEIGLHHEQQHQELLLMDVKHLLASNPLEPSYLPPRPSSEPGGEPDSLAWIARAGGEQMIGHAGDAFCYDNETPRHRVLLEDHTIADRLVTNAEWLAFMEDGGYERSGLWLSDGWDAVRARSWNAPLYWRRRDDAWHEVTLRGTRPVVPRAPVVHVSYYEADAFARWAGHRLPTEAEWEALAAGVAVSGNFVDSGALHPMPAAPSDGGTPRQLFGDVWELTASAYQAYPRYQPLPGALGEYNGKFMSGQQVLRGGSCVSPADHLRLTYRNFFYPAQRWCFQGLRLARHA